MVNKNMVGRLIIVGLAILLVIIVVVGAGGTGLAALGEARTIECDVTIDLALSRPGGVELETITCENTGKFCISPFLIFQREGNVEMWDSNGKLGTKDFEIGTFNFGDKVTVRGCTDSTEVRIRLYDDDHNFLEEKIKQI